MEGIQAIPYIFLALAVAAVVGGAGAVVQAEFGDTVDTCWNDTYTVAADGTQCLNVSLDYNLSSPSASTRNFSHAYLVIWEGLDATSTVGGQLGTVGIIGIMVIIIGLLAGVFVYLKHFM